MRQPHLPEAHAPGWAGSQTSPSCFVPGVQTPFWQILPVAQVVPFLTRFGLVTQRLVATSQVAFLQGLAGCLQVGNFREQLHFLLPVGPTHLPVLHWLPLVQLEPPLSKAARASRTERAL